MQRSNTLRTLLSRQDLKRFVPQRQFARKKDFIEYDTTKTDVPRWWEMEEWGPTSEPHVNLRVGAAITLGIMGLTGLAMWVLSFNRSSQMDYKWKSMKEEK